MEESISTVKCSCCHKLISSQNISIHEVHCKRYTTQCPVCHEKILQYQLQSHHEEVHQLVQCDLCSQEYEIQFEESHQSACMKRLQSCPFCDLPLPKCEISAHKETCGARTDICEICHTYVKFSDKEKHILSGCTFCGEKYQNHVGSRTGYPPHQQAEEDSEQGKMSPNIKSGLDLDKLRRMLQERRGMKATNVHRPRPDKNNFLSYKFELGEMVKASVDYTTNRKDQVHPRKINDTEYLSQIGIISNTYQHGKSEKLEVMFADGTIFNCSTATLEKVSDISRNQKTTNQLYEDCITRFDLVKLHPKIQSEKDVQRFLQESPTEDFLQTIGLRGRVLKITNNFAVLNFMDLVKYRIHLSGIVKASTLGDIIDKKDVVLITFDRQFAIEEQSKAGGWFSGMSKCLNTTGIVTRQVSINTFQVRAKNGNYIWNRKCLTLLSKAGDYQRLASKTAKRLAIRE